MRCDGAFGLALCDDLGDDDQVGQLRLEAAQVLAAKLAGHPEADDAFRHVGKEFDRRVASFAIQGGACPVVAVCEASGPLAVLLTQAGQDLTGIEKSTLYWVVREMTDLAVGAAASLPEWSPAAVIPAEFGLLCWAKPVGSFDWPVPSKPG